MLGKGQGKGVSVTVRSALAVLLLVCICLPVSAAQLAANVILSKGSVTATALDGSRRSLKRRSSVYSGDVIHTGVKGSVQLRFVDKALMTIKANSEMNISQYVLGSAQDQEQAIMRLVKGGFRTITGAIGKGDKSAYIVYTPAASVGIRGTNYEVQQEASGSFVMAVYTGGISVSNDAGSIDLGLDSGFNFTRVSPGKAPVGLLLAPASLNVNSADEEEEQEKEEQKGDAAAASEEDSEEDSGAAEEASPADDEAAVASEETEESDASPIVTELASAADSAADTDTEVSSALDKKLTEEINDDAEDTSEQAEEDAVAMIDSPFPPPYDAPFADIANPFPSVLSADEWDLMATKQFGSVTFGLDYNIGSDGLPNLKTQLESPNAITVNDFIAFDYSGSGQEAHFHLNYVTLDSGSDLGSGFEVLNTAHIFINENTTSLQQLLVQINQGLQDSGAPVEALLISDINGDKFVFRPTQSSNEFIIHMGLEFDSSTELIDQQLMAQMGGSSNPATDWQWFLNLHMTLADASWRVENDTPVWGLFLNFESSDSSGSSGDSSSLVIEENSGEHDFDYAEVVTRNSDETVTNYEDFLGCADNHLICDIQVNEVAVASNVRWGAWLARPGNGIAVTISVNSGHESFDESFVEETNLFFGVIAERADINQLAGTATFSSFDNTNCSDYSQCIGFADDGIVSSVHGGFNVDFNSGHISDGHLKVETMGASTSQVATTWDVNFSGQMHTNDAGGIIAPEFYTSQIGGTVDDSLSGTFTNEVTGTVGGIFVKPGNVFAGGFNLGTTDNSNKHTAGVFSLQQE